MAKQEARLNRLPVYMIPKNKVADIENKLQNGDIIGIARTKDGSYCSHVGIVIKDSKGNSRFMHASSTHKKVLIDSTISGYLYQYKKHAGILVARPK
jgi:cell wall-associated NlpC family hydrolase